MLVYSLLLLSQKLASSLDEFDRHVLLTHPMRTHAWALLSGLEVESSTGLSTKSSGFFGKTMLGYQILDTFAKTLSFPHHPLLRIDAPQGLILNDDIPARLEKTLKKLDGWPAIVIAAKEYFLGQAPIDDVPIALDDADSGFALAVRNLMHTVHHQSVSNWQQILTNIYAAAFVVQWHSPVSISHFMHSDSTELI
jgi:hypothetical protein